MTTRDLQAIDIRTRVPVGTPVDPAAADPALGTSGPERIDLGGDASYVPGGPASRYPRHPSRACYTLCVSEVSVRTIFGGNAARLPGLEDAA